MSQVIEVVERYILPDLPDSSQLPEEDGVPMETNWHRSQMNLLVDVVRHRWQDRRDFFTDGNMFVYYSMNQVRNRNYKGPDFFVVKGIDGSYPRQKWVVWEEDARFPNVIVELMSESTRDEEADEHGRLWSSELDAWLGLWQGKFLEEEAVWLRLFDEDGQVGHSHCR
ncbi:MAG: Uma2 family endonuclease [Chloroflexi bacterium]|nr:Uma2 family endonuclease [Chloroflexota bacterium]